MNDSDFKAFPASPEIEVDLDRMTIPELAKLSMKCVVQSHTAVNVSWKFEGKILKQIAFKYESFGELFKPNYL